MQFLKDLLRAAIGLPFVLVGILFAFFSVAGFISGDKWFATGFLSVGLILGFIGFRILGLRRRLKTSASFGRGTGRKSWRDDPSSDRQKSFAEELGIDYPSNIRKGDLSDLISQKLSKKTAALWHIGWAVVLIVIAGWLVFKSIDQQQFHQPAQQPVRQSSDTAAETKSAPIPKFEVAPKPETVSVDSHNETTPTDSSTTTSEKKILPGFRTWTDSTGQHKTEAKFAGMAFGKVKLMKEDGTTIELSFERLSKEDQQWIEDRKKGKNK